MSGTVVLIGGGVRSGKSAFALERARRAGPRRVFIATAQAWDDEMRARIDAHRRERGREFETIEEPFELGARLSGLRGCDAVVVDCLTLWLSNLLVADQSDEQISRAVTALASALRALPFTAVLVTNEVGMGIVPESALGRRFRDLAGTLHQRLAPISDELYLAALGTVLRLKPSPVEPVSLKETLWT